VDFLIEAVVVPVVELVLHAVGSLIRFVFHAVAAVVRVAFEWLVSLGRRP